MHDAVSNISRGPVLHNAWLGPVASSYVKFLGHVRGEGFGICVEL